MGHCHLSVSLQFGKHPVELQLVTGKLLFQAYGFIGL